MTATHGALRGLRFTYLPVLSTLLACSSTDAGNAPAALQKDAGAPSSGGAQGNSGGVSGNVNGGRSSSSGGAIGSGGGSTAGGSSGTGGSGGTSTGGTAGAPGDGGSAGAAGADSGASPCSGPRPGPDNTGVPKGTVLTPSGSIQVTTDGAIVEDLDISGTITVLANDVTIRRVHIRTGDYYPIRYFDNGNTGLLVEDSEIEATSGNATSGIAFANYTARRLNIHGAADGLKADSNVLIEDCWIHDLSNGPTEHNDDVQSTGGKGVTIRHNDLSGASNACVQTGDENAATEDLTIECNWLDGGGWTLNIRGAGATVPKNTKILNNRFERNAGYGPWKLDDPNPTVRSNVYDDNGEAIPYP